MLYKSSANGSLFYFSCTVKTETKSMKLSYSVTLKSNLLIYLALQTMLAWHNFTTSSLGYLEKNGSMIFQIVTHFITQ
jgi:hypothetical protein